MHIMHVIDSLSVGGAERMLVDIANQTVADGHPVSACVTRTGCELASALRNEVALYVLHRQGRFDWRAIRRLRHIIEEHHVDLLHVHGRSSFALLSLMKTLGFVRVPVLLHDHYGSIEIDTSAPWWFRLWGKYLLAHYVGVYEKLGEWARSTGVPEERISVIGNALDLERVEREDAANIRAELRIEEGIPVGIVVCGLRWEKGIDLLLEAAARIADHLRFRIVLVGGARDAQYARSCRELRSTLGLEEKVIFLGERSNVPAILRDMDFALVPSRSESGPLVLIEYMAAGLPFVATRVGDISGRVEAAGIPGFVPPGEPASFAEALENLLELRPDARTRRGEIGRQMAFREFDIRSNIGKWYQTYSGVLEIS